MASSRNDQKGKNAPPPTRPEGSRSIADVLKKIDKPELKEGPLKEDFDNLQASVQKNDMKVTSQFAATFIKHTVDRHGKSCLTKEQLQGLQGLLKNADGKDFEKVLKMPLPRETDAVDAGSAERPPVQEGTGSAPNNSTSSNTDSDQLPLPQSSVAKSHGKGNTNMTPTKSDGSPVTRQKIKENERSGAHAEEKSSSTLNDKELVKKREAEIKELEKEREHQAEVEKNQREKLDSAERKMKTALAEKESLRKDLEDRQAIVVRQEQQMEQLNYDNTNLQGKLREIEEKEAALNKMNKECQMKEAALNKMNKECQIALEKAFKDNNNRMTDVKDKHESELRALKGQLSDVLKEREDLKTRFSKLAGSKLTDQNADIADLSDPNRAMKISEKFSQVYDDEWTDAFEALKGKKVQARDAIQLLLSILQDCQTFCNNIKDDQMISLNNVLLHPSQNVTKFATEPRKNISGLKENPRMSAKDEKVVRSVRRQIGVSETCLNEIKQVFILETKSWDKRGYDKKLLELCTSYLQKCAEVCWLMVLHDPPLFMKMDIKQGEKLDPNLYTVYSSSGDKIDYLVWPPLFNEFGGGLISKGVAEPQKIVKKK